MTNEELIYKLQNFQDWRRGKHDDMPHPKDIGEWIDEAIARIKAQQSEVSELNRKLKITTDMVDFDLMVELEDRLSGSIDD